MQFHQYHVFKMAMTGIKVKKISSWYIFCSFRFIYETEHHNGIAELLEILGR